MNRKIVLLMVVSAVLGAALVPPVVDAATQLVTIKGAGNNNKAKVTGGGRLRIDTEAIESLSGALDVLAFSIPGGGMFTFDEGNASTALPFELALLTHVGLDLPTGNGPVTLTLSDQFGTIWQGTVDGTNRHIDAAFETGMIWGPDLQVTVAGTGAHYTLDGIPFQGGAAAGKRSATAERARELLRSR